MKLSDAIEEFDALCANSIDQAIKVRWISDLDMQVWREVLMPHRIGPACIKAYTADTDMDTELLIAEGYTECYRHFMEAKLAQAMHEDAGYNRAVNAFNEQYRAYADWVNRTFMPRRQNLRLV